MAPVRPTGSAVAAGLVRHRGARPRGLAPPVCGSSHPRAQFAANHWYAREETSPASASGQTRREISFNSGGGICPRGNGPHSRRRTRRSFGQASHCHWPIQSPARRRKTSAAQERHNLHRSAQTGTARIKARGQRSEQDPFPGTFARGQEKVEGRAAFGRFPSRPVTTSTRGGQKAQRPRSFERRQEGRANTGEKFLSHDKCQRDTLGTTSSRRPASLR